MHGGLDPPHVRPGANMVQTRSSLQAGLGGVICFDARASHVGQSFATTHVGEDGTFTGKVREYIWSCGASPPAINKSEVFDTHIPHAPLKTLRTKHAAAVIASME